MGGYETSYNAWCSPTTAANQLGHMVDYPNFSGLTQPTFINDNIIAGLEKPIATHISTKMWDSANGWGDYLLDGPGYRGKINEVSDFGWYMQTNNLGSNGASANSAIGTTIQNIYLGMQKFYNELGWYDVVSMSYNKVSPNYLGNATLTLPEYWKQQGYTSNVGLDREVMFETIKTEIDANRTVIACFQGWSLTQTSYPDTNIEKEENYHGTFYNLELDVSPNQLTGEQYSEQIDNGEYGNLLGHTVLIIGYIIRGSLEDPEGNTDWLIVRDNQSNTARNVIIPYQNMATQTYNGWDKLLATVYVNFSNGSYSVPEPERTGTCS